MNSESSLAENKTNLVENKTNLAENKTNLVENKATLVFDYIEGMAAARAVVESELCRFERECPSTRRARFKSQLRRILIPTLIPDLIDVIVDYMVLITVDDAAQILRRKPFYGPFTPETFRWGQNLLILSIDLGSLPLFRYLFHMRFIPGRNGDDWIQGFGGFKRSTAETPTLKFWQLAINLMCYCGHGYDPRWIRPDFVGSKNVMSAGILYMAAGTGPVRAIGQFHNLHGYGDAAEMLDFANRGKKDPSVIEYLRGLENACK